MESGQQPTEWTNRVLTSYRQLVLAERQAAAASKNSPGRSERCSFASEAALPGPSSPFDIAVRGLTAGGRFGSGQQVGSQHGADGALFADGQTALWANPLYGSRVSNAGASTANTSPAASSVLSSTRVLQMGMGGPATYDIEPPISSRLSSMGGAAPDTHRIPAPQLAEQNPFAASHTSMAHPEDAHDAGTPRDPRQLGKHQPRSRQQVDTASPMQSYTLPAPEPTTNPSAADAAPRPVCDSIYGGSDGTSPTSSAAPRTMLSMLMAGRQAQTAAPAATSQHAAAAGSAAKATMQHASEHHMQHSPSTSSALHAGTHSSQATSSRTIHTAKEQVQRVRGMGRGRAGRSQQHPGRQPGTAGMEADSSRHTPSPSRGGSVRSHRADPQLSSSRRSPSTSATKVGTFGSSPRALSAPGRACPFIGTLVPCCTSPMGDHSSCGPGHTNSPRHSSVPTTSPVQLVYSPRAGQSNQQGSPARPSSPSPRYNNRYSPAHAPAVQAAAAASRVSEARGLSVGNMSPGRKQSRGSPGKVTVPGNGRRSTSSPAASVSMRYGDAGGRQSFSPPLARRSASPGLPTAPPYRGPNMTQSPRVTSDSVAGTHGATGADTTGALPDGGSSPTAADYNRHHHHQEQHQHQQAQPGSGPGSYNPWYLTKELRPIRTSVASEGAQSHAALSLRTGSPPWISPRSTGTSQVGVDAGGGVVETPHTRLAHVARVSNLTRAAQDQLNAVLARGAYSRYSALQEPKEAAMQVVEIHADSNNQGQHQVQVQEVYAEENTSIQQEAHGAAASPGTLTVEEALPVITQSSGPNAPKQPTVNSQHMSTAGTGTGSPEAVRTAAAFFTGRAVHSAPRPVGAVIKPGTGARHQPQQGTVAVQQPGADQQHPVFSGQVTGPAGVGGTHSMQGPGSHAMATGRVADQWLASHPMAFAPHAMQSLSASITIPAEGSTASLVSLPMPPASFGSHPVMTAEASQVFAANSQPITAENSQVLLPGSQPGQPAGSVGGSGQAAAVGSHPTAITPLDSPRSQASTLEVPTATLTQPAYATLLQAAAEACLEKPSKRRGRSKQSNVAAGVVSTAAQGAAALQTDGAGVSPAPFGTTSAVGLAATAKPSASQSTVASSPGAAVILEPTTVAQPFAYTPASSGTAGSLQTPTIPAAPPADAERMGLPAVSATEPATPGPGVITITTITSAALSSAEPSRPSPTAAAASPVTANSSTGRRRGPAMPHAALAAAALAQQRRQSPLYTAGPPWMRLGAAPAPAPTSEPVPTTATPVSGTAGQDTLQAQPIEQPFPLPVTQQLPTTLQAAGTQQEQQGSTGILGPSSAQQLGPASYPVDDDAASTVTEDYEPGPAHHSSVSHVTAFLPPQQPEAAAHTSTSRAGIQQGNQGQGHTAADALFGRWWAAKTGRPYAPPTNQQSAAAMSETSKQAVVPAVGVQAPAAPVPLQPPGAQVASQAPPSQAAASAAAGIQPPVEATSGPAVQPTANAAAAAVPTGAGRTSTPGGSQPGQLSAILKRGGNAWGMIPGKAAVPPAQGRSGSPGPGARMQATRGGSPGARQPPFLHSSQQLPHNSPAFVRTGSPGARSPGSLHSSQRLPQGCSVRGQVYRPVSGGWSAAAGQPTGRSTVPSLSTGSSGTGMGSPGRIGILKMGVTSSSPGRSVPLAGSTGMPGAKQQQASVVLTSTGSTRGSILRAGSPGTGRTSLPHPSILTTGLGSTGAPCGGNAWTSHSSPRAASPTGAAYARNTCASPYSSPRAASPAAQELLHHGSPRQVHMQARSQSYPQAVSGQQPVAMGHTGRQQSPDPFKQSLQATQAAGYQGHGADTDTAEDAQLRRAKLLNAYLQLVARQREGQLLQPSSQPQGAELQQREEGRDAESGQGNAGAQQGHSTSNGSPLRRILQILTLGKAGGRRAASPGPAVLSTAWKTTGGAQEQSQQGDDGNCTVPRSRSAGNSPRHTPVAISKPTADANSMPGSMTQPVSTQPAAGAPHAAVEVAAHVASPRAAQPGSSVTTAVPQTMMQQQLSPRRMTFPLHDMRTSQGLVASTNVRLSGVPGGLPSGAHAHTLTQAGPRRSTRSPPQSPGEARERLQPGTYTNEAVALQVAGGTQHQPVSLLDTSAPQATLTIRPEQQHSPQVSTGPRQSSPGRSQHQAYSLRRKCEPPSPPLSQSMVEGATKGSNTMGNQTAGATTSSAVLDALYGADSKTITTHMHQGKGHPLPGLAEQESVSWLRAGSGVYDLQQQHQHQQPTSPSGITTTAGSSPHAALSAQQTSPAPLVLPRGPPANRTSSLSSPPASPGSYQSTRHGQNATHPRSPGRQGYAAAAEARSAWKDLTQQRLSSTGPSPIWHQRAGSPTGGYAARPGALKPSPAMASASLASRLPPSALLAPFPASQDLPPELAQLLMSSVTQAATSLGPKYTSALDLSPRVHILDQQQQVSTAQASTSKAKLPGTTASAQLPWQSSTSPVRGRTSPSSSITSRPPWQSSTSPGKARTSPAASLAQRPPWHNQTPVTTVPVTSRGYAAAPQQLGEGHRAQQMQGSRGLDQPQLPGQTAAQPAHPLSSYLALALARRMGKIAGAAGEQLSPAKPSSSATAGSRAHSSLAVNVNAILGTAANAADAITESPAGAAGVLAKGPVFLSPQLMSKQQQRLSKGRPVDDAWLSESLQAAADAAIAAMTPPAPVRTPRVTRDAGAPPVAPVDPLHSVSHAGPTTLPDTLPAMVHVGAAPALVPDLSQHHRWFSVVDKQGGEGGSAQSPSGPGGALESTADAGNLNRSTGSPGRHMPGTPSISTGGAGVRGASRPGSAGRAEGRASPSNSYAMRYLRTHDGSSGGGSCTTKPGDGGGIDAPTVDYLGTAASTAEAAAAAAVDNARTSTTGRVSSMHHQQTSSDNNPASGSQPAPYTIHSARTTSSSSEAELSQLFKHPASSNAGTGSISVRPDFMLPLTVDGMVATVNPLYESGRLVTRDVATSMGGSAGDLQTVPPASLQGNKPAQQPSSMLQGMAGGNQEAGSQTPAPHLAASVLPETVTHIDSPSSGYLQQHQGTTMTSVMEESSTTAAAKTTTTATSEPQLEQANMEAINASAATREAGHRASSRGSAQFDTVSAPLHDSALSPSPEGLNTTGAPHRHKRTLSDALGTHQPTPGPTSAPASVPAPQLWSHVTVLPPSVISAASVTGIAPHVPPAPEVVSTVPSIPPASAADVPAAMAHAPPVSAPSKVVVVGLPVSPPSVQGSATVPAESAPQIPPAVAQPVSTEIPASSQPSYSSHHQPVAISSAATAVQSVLVQGALTSLAGLSPGADARTAQPNSPLPAGPRLMGFRTPTVISVTGSLHPATAALDTDPAAVSPTPRPHVRASAAAAAAALASRTLTTSVQTGTPHSRSAHVTHVTVEAGRPPASQEATAAGHLSSVPATADLEGTPIAAGPAYSVLQGVQLSLDPTAAATEQPHSRLHAGSAQPSTPGGDTLVHQGADASVHQVGSMQGAAVGSHPGDNVAMCTANQQAEDSLGHTGLVPQLHGQELVGPTLAQTEGVSLHAEEAGDSILLGTVSEDLEPQLVVSQQKCDQEDEVHHEVQLPATSASTSHQQLPAAGQEVPDQVQLPATTSQPQSSSSSPSLPPQAVETHIPTGQEEAVLMLQVQAGAEQAHAGPEQVQLQQEQLLQPDSGIPQLMTGAPDEGQLQQEDLSLQRQQQQGLLPPPPPPPPDNCSSPTLHTAPLSPPSQSSSPDIEGERWTQAEGGITSAESSPERLPVFVLVPLAQPVTPGTAGHLLVPPQALAPGGLSSAGQAPVGATATTSPEPQSPASSIRLRYPPTSPVLQPLRLSGTAGPLLVLPVAVSSTGGEVQPMVQPEVPPKPEQALLSPISGPPESAQPSTLTVAVGRGQVLQEPQQLPPGHTSGPRTTQATTVAAAPTSAPAAPSTPAVAVEDSMPHAQQPPTEAVLVSQAAAKAPGPLTSSPRAESLCSSEAHSQEAPLADNRPLVSTRPADPAGQSRTDSSAPQYQQSPVPVPAAEQQARQAFVSQALHDVSGDMSVAALHDDCALETTPAPAVQAGRALELQQHHPPPELAATPVVEDTLTPVTTAVSIALHPSSDSPAAEAVVSEVRAAAAAQADAEEHPAQQPTSQPEQGHPPCVEGAVLGQPCIHGATAAVLSEDAAPPEELLLMPALPDTASHADDTVEPLAAQQPAPERGRAEACLEEDTLVEADEPQHRLPSAPALPAHTDHSAAISLADQSSQDMPPAHLVSGQPAAQTAEEEIAQPPATLPTSPASQLPEQPAPLQQEAAPAKPAASSAGAAVPDSSTMGQDAPSTLPPPPVAEGSTPNPGDGQAGSAFSDSLEAPSSHGPSLTPAALPSLPTPPLPSNTEATAVAIDPSAPPAALPPSAASSMLPSLVPTAAAGLPVTAPILAIQIAPGPRDSFTFSPPILSRTASASGVQGLLQEDGHQWPLGHAASQQSMPSKTSLPGDALSQQSFPAKSSVPGSVEQLAVVPPQGSSLPPAVDSQHLHAATTTTSSPNLANASSARRSWQSMWAPEVTSHASSGTQQLLATVPAPAAATLLVPRTAPAGGVEPATSAEEGKKLFVRLPSPKRRLQQQLAAHPLADVGINQLGDSTGSSSSWGEIRQQEQAEAEEGEQHGARSAPGGSPISPQGSHALASSTSSSPSTAPSFSPLPPAPGPEPGDEAVDDAETSTMMIAQLSKSRGTSEGCPGSTALSPDAAVKPAMAVADSGNAPTPVEADTVLHMAATAPVHTSQAVQPYPQLSQQTGPVGADWDLQALMEEMEAGVEEVVIVRTSSVQQDPLPACRQAANTSGAGDQQAVIHSSKAEVHAGPIKEQVPIASASQGSGVCGAAKAVAGAAKHQGLTAGLGCLEETSGNSSPPRAVMVQSVPIPETPTVRRSSPLSSPPPPQLHQQLPSQSVAVSPSHNRSKRGQTAGSSVSDPPAVQAALGVPPTSPHNVHIDLGRQPTATPAQPPSPSRSLPLSQSPSLDPAVQQPSATPATELQHYGSASMSGASPAQEPLHHASSATSPAGTARPGSRSATPSPLRQRLQKLGGVLLQGAALAATGMLGAGLTQASLGESPRTRSRSPSPLPGQCRLGTHPLSPSAQRDVGCPVGRPPAAKAEPSAGAASCGLQGSKEEAQPQQGSCGVASPSAKCVAVASANVGVIGGSCTRSEGQQQQGVQQKVPTPAGTAASVVPRYETDMSAAALAPGAGGSSAMGAAAWQSTTGGVPSQQAGLWGDAIEMEVGFPSRKRVAAILKEQARQERRQRREDGGA